MSNVFAKDRTETKLAFYVTALDIQEQITMLCMKERLLPKKWRYAIGYPLIAKLDELVDNIIYANSIYPVTNEELVKRKYYQTLALANCFQIQNKLIRAERCIETIKIDNFENVILLLYHEINLLKAWRKSSKILSK